MEKLKQIAGNLQALFNETAQHLAVETGFRQRRSKLDGATFAKALIGGWLSNPEASRSELAQIAKVSKQALDQSFTSQAASYLQALLGWCVEKMLGQEPASLSLLQRFKGVYVLDSSTISLPPTLSAHWQGCGKEGSQSEAGLKLHVGLELLSGALLGPELSPARLHDRQGPHQKLSLPAGALRITDLGYFKLGRLKELEAQAVLYLTKAQTGLQVYGAHQQPLALSKWLGQQSQKLIDRVVEVGVKERLRCRLVAWQVPSGVVQTRQQAFKELARKQQRPVSAERQALSYWSVYLTNLSQEQASPAEVAVLYRLRWQIELLFKLWKSGGGLERWHSHKPWAILCEIYAKLIGQIIQHWLVLAGVWQEAERSLIKASRIVRAHARSLLFRIDNPPHLLQELIYICASMQKGCRLDRKKSKPSSFQLLNSPPILLPQLLN
ncbi:IS4 family transposase (plasmid) [Candidatus Chlorohelix allophototropha]|uniref:IS4 family transposase n=1 Tax=Candidatus Chlorohelix allophototropha TaxID=3003348 RepID=A0ABY9BB23_9CHLR|nr:IS4 family transposase [Chloroflexota bacterium L227-S17]